MKKFISDNIVWFVVAAIALSAFAVYKINKGAEEVSETATEE